FLQPQARRRVCAPAQASGTACVEDALSRRALARRTRGRRVAAPCRACECDGAAARARARRYSRGAAARAGGGERRLCRAAEARDRRIARERLALLCVRRRNRRAPDVL